MVMMWRAERRLISSTSAASVVVFPGAGRPADQHQAARKLREQFHLRRQIERGQPRDRAPGASAPRPRPGPAPDAG